jgi:hypothetical protein
MRDGLFVAGIFAAVAVGLWQGPRAESALALSGSASGCNYSGYDQTDCSTVDEACSAGHVKAAIFLSTDNQDYKSSGTIQSGSCTGGAGCSATYGTADLTDDGCTE